MKNGLTSLFITVNKYRFCISVIGNINMQIIGIVIGYKKINIGRSLDMMYLMLRFSRLELSCKHRYAGKTKPSSEIPE